jgi:hypothetical protein
MYNLVLSELSIGNVFKSALTVTVAIYTAPGSKSVVVVAFFGVLQLFSITTEMNSYQMPLGITIINRMLSFPLTVVPMRGCDRDGTLTFVRSRLKGTHRLRPKLHSYIGALQNKCYTLLGSDK